MPRLLASGNNPADVAIGARIRIRRQSIGLTQQALAEKLEISFQQVQKYESGSNRVSASSLLRIAEILACPASQLLGEQEAAAETESLSLLAAPGAVELLQFYARVRDYQTRAAILAVVKGLAEGAAPGLRDRTR